MTNNTDQRDRDPAPGVYTLACGQADSHLIITPNGTKGLIDADRGRAIEELNELFGRPDDATDDITLDFLHTTHIHEDHVLGIRDLNDAGYMIKNAYQPPTARYTRDVDEGVKSTVSEEYYTALLDHDIAPDDIQEVTTGDEIFREGDVALTVLSPPATSESIEFDHPITGEPCEYGCEKANPNSAACRYDGPYNSYLFMGDIENKPDHNAEAWLLKQHDNGAIDLNADVLIMGHHGSNNAGNRPLLETAGQDWTMISADSTYHPATETLRTLQVATDSGVSVTGIHGQTAFTGDLPPTSTNTNAPIEPWRIDRDKHASPWSEIVGQERTEKEELEAEKANLAEENEQLRGKNEQERTKNEQLVAQSSPTMMDRLRSAVSRFGTSNGSTTLTESTNRSPPNRSQPDEQTATAQTEPDSNTDEQGVHEAFRDQKPTGVTWKSEEEMEKIRSRSGIENGGQNRDATAGRDDTDNPSDPNEHSDPGGFGPR